MTKPLRGKIQSHGSFSFQRLMLVSTTHTNSLDPWPHARRLRTLGHCNSIISIDLTSVFNCAHSVGRIFRSQHLVNPTHPLGSFIATASISAHIVNLPQQQAAYNAAKAGLIHMCKSLAVEWVDFARVNTVSPGYIITPIAKFCSEDIKREWHKRIPMG